MLQFLIKWGAILAVVTVVIKYPDTITNVVKTVVSAVIKFFVALIKIILDIVVSAAGDAGAKVLDFVAAIVS